MSPLYGPVSYHLPLSQRIGWVLSGGHNDTRGAGAASQCWYVTLGVHTRPEEPLISGDNHKNKVEGALCSHPPFSPHRAPRIIGRAAPAARVTRRSKPCVGSGNVEAEAQAGGWHLCFRSSKISIQRWELGLEGWVRGTAGRPELPDSAWKLTGREPGASGTSTSSMSDPIRVGFHRRPLLLRAGRSDRWWQRQQDTR